MVIKLMKNSDEKVKVVKNPQLLTSISGTLKQNTDLVNPTILITTTATGIQAITEVNYIYIEYFKRYYFVNTVRNIRTNLWELECHVDVLMSYADQIKQNTAIVARQENNWNMLLDDGSFQVYSDPIIATKAFPNSFNSHSYILTVAG